jgi:ribosomal-protein-alanine N-acetyltransferase
MNSFETTRLLFRHHVPGDLEPYCAIESDPQYRFPQRVHSRAELERSFREAWLPPKAMGLLAAVFKPDGHYIGRCGLYPRRGEDDRVVSGEACLAFYFARAYWGRGLAFEAGQFFVRYGFDVLHMLRIEAGMSASNLASIRVIEKLGFTWTRSGEGGGSQWHEYELRRPASA